MTKERWQQINEIFEAALERPPSERTAFVAERCRKDLPLRLEVEALLSGYRHADSFMGQHAVSAFATELGVDSRVLQPGAVVSGRFQINRFIGEGGMGEVYEAKDLEIGIRVALKTLHPEISSDPAMLSRFKKELHLARLVTHPNVCRTFDMARHESSGSQGPQVRDVIYLTMELLEGETLAERLRRERITTDEALPIILQMADALHAAHSAGVIHCDFKPANVILCHSPESTVEHQTNVRVVVTDFGVARSVSRASNLRGLPNRSGRTIGTVAYMAPEQIERKEITPATDIYAFGLVIYEMVTGTRPFESSGPIEEVLQRLESLPPSPRLKSGDLDPSWESAIMCCLEIDPQRRFRSIKQVSALLSTVGDPPIRHYGRLRKGLLVAGLAIMVLTVASIVVWAFRAFEAGTATTKTSPSTRITSDGGLTFQPNISLDGNTLVYASDRAGDGVLNLWVKDAVGHEPRQLTHERSNVLEPALSPDGSQVAFVSEANGAIYMIPARGGPVRRLAPRGHTPRFSPNSKQILYWDGGLLGEAADPYLVGARMYVVSAEGGIPHVFQPHFVDARYPNWTEDGHHVFFQATLTAQRTLADTADWWVADLNSPERPATKTGVWELLRQKSILPFTSPQWWHDSIIFSARVKDSINLFRVRISPDWHVKDQPEQVPASARAAIAPSISQNGAMFFTNWNITGNIWSLPLVSSTPMPASEKDLRRLTSAEALEFHSSISLDGNRIAFLRNVQDLLVKDLSSGVEIPIASAMATSVLISRDGSQVAYSVTEKSQQPIKIVRIGSSTPETICADCGAMLDWSRDGSQVLYSVGNPSAVGLLDMGSGKHSLLLQSSKALLRASFDPRGEGIAVSERIDPTHGKIWFAPLHGRVPGNREEWTPLTDGEFLDDKPHWSVDGKWIYFVSNRDGFACIWKMRRNFRRWRSAEPVPVLDMHQASASLGNIGAARWDFHLAGNKLILSFIMSTGNIWKVDLQQQ